MHKPLLVLLMVSLGIGAKLEPTNFINKFAENPRFNVWNVADRTQITFTNGDPDDPQIVIFVCKPAKEELDIQYYMGRDGLMGFPVDFFTIQRYPPGELDMVYPYLPPAKVVYDAGMGLNKDFFSEVLDKLKEGGDWNYTFTFETIIEGRGAVTQAWSNLIPAGVFKRDLTGKDITDCLSTRNRIMLPLLTGD